MQSGFLYPTLTHTIWEHSSFLKILVFEDLCSIDSYLFRHVWMAQWCWGGWYPHSEDRFWMTQLSKILNESDWELHQLHGLLVSSSGTPYQNGSSAPPWACVYSLQLLPSYISLYIGWEQLKAINAVPWAQPTALKRLSIPDRDWAQLHPGLTTNWDYCTQISSEDQGLRADAGDGPLQ